MSFFPIAAGALGDLIEQIVAANPDAPTYSSLMSRWQSLAVRMIKRFSSGKIIMVSITSVKNPTDPTDTNTQYRAQQYVDAYVSGYSDKELSLDPNLHAADRKVYVAGKTLENTPVKKGVILIGNKGHTIEDVKQIPADGLVALYIIQARTV